jgi:thioredoxin-like negative regulator of GroEL
VFVGGLSRHRAPLLWSSLALSVALGCAHAPPQVSGEALQAELSRLHSANQQWYRAVPGQAVLVSFFATWCFPCVAQIEDLRAIHQAHAGADFALVSVGMDLEGAAVLALFDEIYRLPYPVLVSTDRLRTGESSFGKIAGLPTTVLIGRDGKVLVAFQGVASRAQLEAWVSQATGAR